MQLRDNLSPSLRRLAAGVENKRPILQAMGMQLGELTRRSFNEPALRPAPWAPKWDGSPATLRKNQVLVRSIGVSEVTNDHVTVSTDRLYAAIHQFGGEIRAKGKALRFALGGNTVFAKKVVMPPRPFFPFIGNRLTPAASDKIQRVGEEKIRLLTLPK
jgi:phage gpG-like protein